MIDPTNKLEIAAWIAAAAPGAQLASDSRRVRQGDVFFAYPGEGGRDGRAFIGAAIEQGAAAIVCEARGLVWDARWNVPHLGVPELKKRAGPVAHAYYAMPDAAMFTVGVTGTNGKTSCALWLGQAFAKLGQGGAVIGTLGVGLFQPRSQPVFDATGYTTPDAVLLARTLAEARDAGAGALAIEVSSIGLDQGRVDGMHFDAALFTNLTRDHLDYHGDPDAYEAAKSALFDWPGLKTAVLNLDDPVGPRLLARIQSRPHNAVAVTGYTLRGAAAVPDIDGVLMLRASALRSRPAGTYFHLGCALGSAQVKTRLVGHFNISNALAVRHCPWR